jgi:hypothetical protein
MNCLLWSGNRPDIVLPRKCFSLFCSTPTHRSFALLLTVLLNSYSLILCTASHCSVELLLTEPLHCFSLFCWIPTHWSFALLLTILFLCSPGPGLKCPRVDHKVLTDRPCWSVIVDSLQRERQSATGLVLAVALICLCLVSSKHATIYIPRLWS